MSKSCLNNVWLNRILKTHTPPPPHKPKLKTFPFQETSMICSEIQIWHLGSLGLATSL